MGYGRVPKYIREFKGQRELVAFSHAQAGSIGAVLETDGLSLDKAIALVRKWNATGKAWGYRYGIPGVHSKHTDA